MQTESSPPISLTETAKREVLDLFHARRLLELEVKITPLLEQYPNWTLGWKVYGIALQIQGKNGIAAFQQVVNLQPSDAEAHMNLGLALQAHGHLDAALASFSQAAHVAPQMAEAHFQQGSVLRKLSKFQSAIASFRNVLAINPNHEAAHSGLAFLLQDMDQSDLALAHFKKVAEIKPSAEAYNNLAVAQQKQLQLEDALLSLRQAIEMKPDFIGLHLNCAVLLRRLSRFDEALTSEGRAFSIQPELFYKDISENIAQNNLIKAEILCRRVLHFNHSDAQALHALGVISWKIQKNNFAKNYFHLSAQAAPDWLAPRESLSQLESELATSPIKSTSNNPHNQQKFLVIKAWGSGFWSDTYHTLGGLLLAEMTKRIPIVHWGKNSLFTDDLAKNAFEVFFEPVSHYSLDDLAETNCEFYPPKWSLQNIRNENIARFSGAYSKMVGLYLLGRQETIVVSDFFTPILYLTPWIESDHPLYGLSVEEICHRLIEKYLKPVKTLQNQVEHFYAQHFSDAPFMAVHARGSDKFDELQHIDQINTRYFEHIEKYANNSTMKIFLLTDSQPIAEEFKQRYGSRLVLTESIRSADRTGVHYNPNHSKTQLAFEVMKDTYLATKAKYFIGNGASNVSCMIDHLKRWDKDACTLLIQNINHSGNYFDPMLDWVLDETRL